MDIGPFIKLHRMKQNMTQEHLAEGIVSESYLSKIENQKTVASQEVINMLCTRLGIQVDHNNDSKIREMSQQWFDKLSIASDKEELKAEYEELQELILTSYSDIQVMFEIHKIRYFLVMDDLSQAIGQINYLKDLSGTFDNMQQYYWLKFCGNYNSLIENFNQALRYYKLAEEKINQIDMAEEEVAELKYTLGVTYSKLRRTLEVIDYANQALEVYRRTYNFRRCAHGHILLGISYRRIRIYDKAIKNYNLANHLATLSNDKGLMNLTNINLGHLYSTVGDSTEAITVFQTVLADENILTDEQRFSAMISLIKECYLTQKYEEAKEQAEKGLRLIEGKDMQRLKSFYYELKTYVYFFQGKEKEFEGLVIGEFIPYLQKQKDHASLILYCNLVGTHFEALNKYKKATKYYKLANSTYEELIRI